MTEKFREILIAALILMFSAVFAYEGRSVMLPGNNHMHLDSDHNTDLEIPHQQKHVESEDEKIVITGSFDLSCPADRIVPVQCINDLTTLDYSGSIWQPPKSS